MNRQELTTRDLMRKYDKTIGTIYNWIAAGIPHTKGKDGMRDVYYFDAEAVEEWLSAERKG